MKESLGSSYHHVLLTSAESGRQVLKKQNFTQIEALLNSRPLSPISSDPNDLQPLTPSHFLIGRTMTSIAEPELGHLPENRLNRYEYVQRLRLNFWNRWHKEYLWQLQNRPPLCWKMGRIISIYQGGDKQGRVASVKVVNGVIKRAIKKLCPLSV